MKKSVALLLVLVLTASSIIAFLPVKAEARKIVVPDDYPTIADAVDNAAAGDTIFFKKGTHEGPIDQTIMIDNSISLIGENAESTILNLHPKHNVTWILTQSFVSSDDAIVIDANDVKLMNLTLFFFGVIRANGNRAQIIGNNMTAWATSGLVIAGCDCNVSNNVVMQQITLTGSSNTVSQNSFYSLTLQSADRNFIDSNRFQYLQLIRSNDNVIYRNNISTDVYGSAIKIQNSTNNILNGNRVEVDRWNTDLRLEFQARNNTFFGNAFIGEDEIVILDATSEDNFWDNGVYGNFWSNYNGTDVFGDGIGDVSYVIDANNQDRYPLMKPLLNGKTIERTFPTMLVAFSVIVAVFLGVVAGLLVYFKKRKR